MLFWQPRYYIETLECFPGLYHSSVFNSIIRVGQTFTRLQYESHRVQYSILRTVTRLSSNFKVNMLTQHSYNNAAATADVSQPGGPGVITSHNYSLTRLARCLARSWPEDGSVMFEAVSSWPTSFCQLQKCAKSEHVRRLEKLYILLCSDVMTLDFFKVPVLSRVLNRNTSISLDSNPKHFQ